MTYAKNPMNALDALYNAVRHSALKVEGVAARLGRGDKLLYAQLRGATHKLSMEDAMAIMEMLADAGAEDAFEALHAMCWRLGFVPVALPPVSDGPDAMIDGMCEAIREHSEAMSAMSEALRDGVITHREAEHCEKQIEEAVAALLQMQKMVKERADSFKGRKS